MPRLEVHDKWRFRIGSATIFPAAHPRIEQRELGLAKPCQPFNRVRWKLGPNFALGAKLIARLGFQSLSSVHQRWSLCRFEPLLFVGGTLRPMIMALHAPCAHLTSGLQVRLRQAFANRRYRPFSVIVRS